MKTRVCDICDRPMNKPNNTQYFKVKCENLLGYYKIDVCQDCFEKFKKFVNDEKSKINS